MEITKKVMIRISSREVVGLLVEILSKKAFASLKMPSADNTKTLLFALSHLPGSSDVKAVATANKRAEKDGWPKITTGEFRRWLPQLLSEVFEEFMGAKREDSRD